MYSTYDSYDDSRPASGGRPYAASTQWQSAQDNLRALARSEQARASLEALLPYLGTVLSGSASPERALTHLSRWLGGSRDQAGVLTRLAAHRRALEMVITLFAGSQFLSGIFLRNPAYFDLMLEGECLGHAKTLPEFLAEARHATLPALPDGTSRDFGPALDALRSYQQREMLCIGVADLCGLLDLSSVTVQLSNLAEAVVRTCLDISAARTGVDPHAFIVVAMGKLGGIELNYSSDIDLLFLAARDAELSERLGRDLIKVLTQVTAEGFFYRVDMRLRPWGRVGPLVPTVDGYRAYLVRHARLWERQALLKARVIAGNEEEGRAVLRWAAAMPLDWTREAVRSDIAAMKQMTESELLQQGRQWGEIKLGEGSIRDVEFVTQFLQLVHGPELPYLLTGNTLEALGRLAEVGLLPPDNHRVLVEGYVFLRTVEHYLQMLDYRQTNTLPAKPAELAYLAQRLGFSGPEAADTFIARYNEHSRAVRAIYQQYLGAIEMSAPVNPTAGTPDNDVRRHLSRMSPSYTAAFTPAEIRVHAAMVERLTDDRPVEVQAEPLGDQAWHVTVVGYDYPGVLSLICGLLFVHGFSIMGGHVHTYEPPQNDASPQSPAARAAGSPSSPAANGRPKIVDVFDVRSVRGEVTPDLWTAYAAELLDLLRLLKQGDGREARGRLAKSVALALREIPATSLTLHPIDLEIDNETSDRYTILRIDTPDTIGFLYEFTNALALTGVYISEVAVSSAGNRIHDTLYVTDARGRKITGVEKQRELRATVVLIKHFTHLLPQSPNPQAALLHFHAYLGELLRRPTWPDELASLERPEVLTALARLLGVSDFLWEDFLRMQYANLFPVMRDVDTLATAKSPAQLRDELAAALAAAPDGTARRAALNAFKDREMFRADMRYILGHVSSFEAFAAELTHLAEIVLAAACQMCDAELRARYGDPCLEDSSPSPLSLCALGKCGGRELGFASDIELMFIYAGNGMTAGPARISTAEYYEKLVPAVVQAIRARREGIFEIDLQLRPYGSAGSLAVSLSSFRRYFAPGGAAWSYERQALIKLRPIAGDTALGAQVTALRDEYVYRSGPFDVVAMRAMRERQIRHLVTAGTFNAKFSSGGLVDVEYLVQALQIKDGGENPRLRTTNTAEALAALSEAGILGPDDYDFLRRAHAFLWRLIEALRVVRGNAKDLTVPHVESEEFAFLARRLGYGSDLERLRTDLTYYTAGTRKMLARL